MNVLSTSQLGASSKVLTVLLNICKKTMHVYKPHSVASPRWKQHFDDKISQHLPVILNSSKIPKLREFKTNSTITRSNQMQIFELKSAQIELKHS